MIKRIVIRYLNKLLEKEKTAKIIIEKELLNKELSKDEIELMNYYHDKIIAINSVIVMVENNR